MGHRAAGSWTKEGSSVVPARTCGILWGYYKRVWGEGAYVSGPLLRLLLLLVVMTHYFQSWRIRLQIPFFLGQEPSHSYSMPTDTTYSVVLPDKAGSEAIHASTFPLSPPVLASSAICSGLSLLLLFIIGATTLTTSRNSWSAAALLACTAIPATASIAGAKDSGKFVASSATALLAWIAASLSQNEDIIGRCCILKLSACRASKWCELTIRDTTALACRSSKTKKLFNPIPSSELSTSGTRVKSSYEAISGWNKALETPLLAAGQISVLLSSETNKEVAVCVKILTTTY